ncbi:hypothetical protein EDC52_107100 [Biostraticola tofi]|uniref:Uncharacterized protein n=1 Tax=Biostraticola tofi TaxID=466109 RepID=A0A4V2W436_9GAMM|nr:hypothetical protein EDC52_107100 [Biostraticola tofi]
MPHEQRQVVRPGLAVTGQSALTGGNIEAEAVPGFVHHRRV